MCDARGTVDAQGMLRIVVATLGGGVCRPVGLLPGWESGLDRHSDFETEVDLSQQKEIFKFFPPAFDTWDKWLMTRFLFQMLFPNNYLMHLHPEYFKACFNLCYMGFI